MIQKKWKKPQDQKNKKIPKHYGNSSWKSRNNIFKQSLNEIKQKLCIYPGKKERIDFFPIFVEWREKKCDFYIGYNCVEINLQYFSFVKVSTPLDYDM